jgi:hypothetical protein
MDHVPTPKYKDRIPDWTVARCVCGRWLRLATDNLTWLHDTILGDSR